MVSTMATPALSSAPNSVVPEAVMMSSPALPLSAGMVSAESTWLGSSGRTIGEPSQLRCTMGLTLAPLKAGAVSTWARKATAGMPSPSTLAGTVAITAP